MQVTPPPDKPPADPGVNNKSTLAADNKAIAEKIAKGHSYDKHILGQPYGRGAYRQVPREFPGAMRTRKQFQDHIENVLNNPNTPRKALPRNRMAYWDDEYGAIIFKDLGARDAGTMSQPIRGRRAFDVL